MTHASLQGHQSRINSLDYSKDGKFIVSGSDDGTARIWDLDTNSHKVLETKTTGGKNIALSSVSVSHDGRLVAAGCMDSIIRIWNVQTGYLVERLRGHGDSVRSVAFTPDGSGLISGSSDNKIKRWDLTPFLQCDAYMEPLQPATSSAPVSVSAPERSMTIPAKGDGERGSVCTLTFNGHKGWVRSVAVSHDGQWVLSGSDDKSVLFWDTRNAQAQFALHGHKRWVRSVDMSSTGDIFATGGFDGVTRICELFKCMLSRAINSDYAQGNTII